MEALLRVSNECGIVVVLLISSDIGKIPLSYGHCNDVRWAAPGAGKLLPATTDRAAYPKRADLMRDRCRDLPHHPEQPPHRGEDFFVLAGRRRSGG
jgi:hypothetical protein